MGLVPWGGKPGYEDRKADLEAKLAEYRRRFRQNDGPLSILHYEQSLNLLFCIVFYKFLWYAEHSNLSLSPGDSISETGVIYYGQTDYGRQGFRQDQAAH